MMQTNDMCVLQDDLSAAALADILRCAKEMEKLRHYYFPRVGVFPPKQRRMLAASSGDKTIDQKYLKSFEMGCWRRLKKTSWTDLLRN